MSTDQNPTGLIEGLRQSAAGEIVNLGSFEQYADTVIEDGEEDAPVRKVGDVFVPTDEEKASWSNLDSYEQATAVWASDDIYLLPIRSGIVTIYAQSDLGYLIQEAEFGFRYIYVEFGEPDDFSAFYKTKQAAIQAAVSNWREYGQGDSWGKWSRQMAKDAFAPAVNADKIAAYLSQTVAAEALTPDKIQTISQGLAEHLAG